MNTLKNNPKMLWTLVCFALLCQTACTNTLKMGMDTDEAAGQEQQEETQPETRVLNLLELPEGLIGGLQSRETYMGESNDYAAENLATLQNALRRIQVGLQDTHTAIRLQNPRRPNYGAFLSKELPVSVLAACIIVPKAPPIELFKALIDAGAPTHGVEAGVDPIPLFELALIHDDCLNVSRRLLENGALEDINLCNDASCIVSRVLSQHGSDDEKVAVLDLLFHNGLEQTDNSGNTELHKDYDSVELDMLLRVQGMHKSLYQSTTYGETPWQTHVRVAACYSNDDDAKEKSLKRAEKLISAMSRHDIVHKKTTDPYGNERPTHYQLFQTFYATSSIACLAIPQDITARIKEAFLNKRLVLPE